MELISARHDEKIVVIKKKLWRTERASKYSAFFSLFCCFLSPRGNQLVTKQPKTAKTAEKSLFWSHPQWLLACFFLLV
jgi:hypothetical protein